MRRFQAAVIFIIAIGAVLIFGMKSFKGTGTIARGAEPSYEDSFWNPMIVESVNQKKLKVLIDNKRITNMDRDIYMALTRDIMVPVDKINSVFNCASYVYDQEQLVVRKNEKAASFFLKDSEDGKAKMSAYVGEKEGKTYIAIKDVASSLGYNYKWEGDKNQLQLTSLQPEESALPAKYDFREVQKKTTVKDQGQYGTCWAFASLTALETTLLPEQKNEFSSDHMSLRNSFGTSQTSGGEYSMAMAYMTAWQGPVLEKDDPYGDGKSPEGLSPTVHVQEAQIMDSKDFMAIKEAVYKYGGVETSIYMDLKNSYSKSDYYNKDKLAYCYIGMEKPNHDVVIIGWDDQYSKSNFNGNVEGDGAFICQNSWGDSFGDKGVFYISYYDTNVGMHNVVYSGVESVDNYDEIYQADLCGWVGQMGYGMETSCFANVYTARGNEKVSAAGFYATGKDTSYKVYVVNKFEGTDSFAGKKYVTEGSFSNPGYYTVKFPADISVPAGQKFAVVVEITTPSSVHPVAIEYRADETTKNADLTDGEGYISPRGSVWERVEEKQGCNVCLKAYTVADNGENQ